MNISFKKKINLRLNHFLCLLLMLILVGCATTNQNINSGLWHYNAGLWNQALPRLLSSVPELEKSNPKDPRLSNALIALGNMAMGYKEFGKAEDYFKRALKAAESQEPQNDNLMREALVHAGNFYLNQKRYSESEPFLKRAVIISEQNKSIPRIIFAIDSDNLGLAYTGQGKHADGNALSQNALKVLNDLVPSNDVKETRGIILYNLGYSYAEQKRFAEAETLYQQALGELSPAGKPAIGEQLRINTILTNYAVLLKQQGRTEEAKALEQQIRKDKGKYAEP